MIDHPKVLIPVIYLPIPILELIVNDQAAELTRLGRILGALRAQRPAWMVPTFEIIPAEYGHNKRFDRKTRCAQILAKRDAAVNQARQAFIRAAYPKITALSANGFQGLHCLTSQRIAEAAEVDKKLTITEVEPVDFLAADIKAKAERAAKRTHAALLAAPRRKKVSVNDEDLEEIKNRLLAEVNEWTKARAVRVAAVKEQTLKEYAASPLVVKSAFPHSQPMPRLRTNFCPFCTEVVTANNSVLRKPKGMYLPKEHECGLWEVDGVPVVKNQSVVVRPTKFRSEEAAQNHFESKLVTFVGDGADLEVIDSFKYNPRTNHSDQREKDLMRWAQRSQVGIVVGPTCLRCTAPITKRKGTKFCTKKCCNLYSERQSKGEQ